MDKNKRDHHALIRYHREVLAS